MQIYIMIHGHNYNKTELYHNKNLTDLNWELGGTIQTNDL